MIRDLSQRGVAYLDDIVVCSPRLGVVHAESDRRRDDTGGKPRPDQCYKNPLGVGSVLDVT